MSLLLDALKKAAEKKAQKDAENTSVEKTDVLTKTQLSDDETIADKTVAMTETELSAEKLDATQIDATELDATELEATHLDKTATDTTLKIDPAQIDVTQLDHSSQQFTQAPEASELDPLKSASSDEETRVDATQLDAVELDASQRDKKATDTTLKTGSTQVESSQLDQVSQESTLELDISKLDLSQLAAEENSHWDSDDDQVLSFLDDEDDTPVEDETEVLTPDDITEFLGDGHYPQDSKPTPVSHIGPDDTTISNSDSLTLADIAQDELEQDKMDDQEYPSGQDSTRTESATYSGFVGEQSLQDHANDHSNADQLDDESSTLQNADGASSTVNIEKLTNDETVTIKDNTFTRTFAPDNYDRTLMKLSENDVSRIFPGMRSETDSVMTPDYAKKVFISKSRGVKNYYYKVYAGVALSILLAVVIWGLFQIQSESESIDNNLIALKRDPMPGIIKPKDQPEPVKLFSSVPQVDNKAIKVIENANAINEGVSGELQQASTEDKGATAAQTQAQKDSVVSLRSQAQKPPATKTAPSSKKQPSASPTKQTSLRISSNNRVSKKDKLLAEAYAAYESGNISEARKKYQQVIALDPENRDALLGRAAIHVYDNQFENAITLYQKLLLANPKDDLAMTSLISVANVDPQVGETEIKRLLTELPDSPYLHFALGNMFGNQNRWPEAQSEYFKALQYKPNDPNYAYNMAISLEHLEKIASAITFYQRALENRANGLASFSEPVVMQRIKVLSQ